MSYTELALKALRDLLKTVMEYAQLEFKEASADCPHKYWVKNFGVACKKRAYSKSVWLCQFEACPFLAEEVKK